MNTNKKVLSFIVKRSKEFSVSLYGFVYAATLFFRIVNSISITILPQFTTKLVSTINQGRVNLATVFRQVGNIVTAINLKKVNLIISVKETGKIRTTIYLRNEIVFISSALQKIVSSVKTGKLSLLISPILATFFTLGTYDPTTLGTQDVKTLGTMDYTT
jgi:hypothetical protein